MVFLLAKTTAGKKDKDLQHPESVAGHHHDRHQKALDQALQYM
jgi:hypothetical protein